MSPLKLYHFPPSFYSQIVRLALFEKGLPWESQFINIGPPLENYKPWYAKLNPEMVVPTVQDDGTIVCGTMKILTHLEKSGEGKSLIPDSAEEMADMTHWLQRLSGFPMREFSYGEGNQRGGFLRWLMGIAMKRRRKVLTAFRDKHPDLREAYQDRLDDMDPWEETMHDPQAVAGLFDRMRMLLEDADATLERRSWLAGESYSMADVWMTVLLARLYALKKDDWVDSLPYLRTYFAKVKVRPSFDQADVWERLKPEVMAPIILRIIWPGLLATGVLLGALIWWLS